MPAVTERDAIDAAFSVDAFWAALAADDDVTLLRVLGEGLAGEVGTAPGICGRLRERLEIDAEGCRHIGIGSTVRVMPEGPMVYLCLQLEPGVPRLVGTSGPEEVHGWGLTVAREGVFWRVTGEYEGEQWPADTRYIELPWAPPPGPSH